MNKQCLCILALLLFSCSFTSAQEKASYTLIFIDKSSSSVNSPETVTAFKSRIKSVISSRYRVPNSIIKGYTIHGGTQSTTTFIDSTFTFMAHNCNECGIMKQKVIAQKNQQTILAIQNRALKIVLNQFSKTNLNSSKLHTDIWGSLELISRSFNTKTGNRLVIYSSDMVESMNGKGRRDFHKKPLTSKNEAEKLAQEDLVWIKNNLKVNFNVFKGLKIEIWPPQHPNQGSQHPYTIYYWEYLFGLLGTKFEWKN